MRAGLAEVHTRLAALICIVKALMRCASIVFRCTAVYIHAACWRSDLVVEHLGCIDRLCNSQDDNDRIL